MENQTTVHWNRERNDRLSLSVQTPEWRLECNADRRDMNCPELLEICSSETLAQVIEEAVSKHLPTWEGALREANPPDGQTKRDNPGYL